MSSIKDVARLAHVSVSTVSNILNNRNNYSIEVYNRVMAAMDELNYSPNMLARNLRANKLLFIGVILPDLSGHYQKVYEGINQMAGQFGYYLILKLSRHNRQLEQTYLEELITLSVRGILLEPRSTTSKSPKSITNARHRIRHSTLLEVVVTGRK